MVSQVPLLYWSFSLANVKNDQKAYSILRKLLLQLSQVFRSTSLPWTSARWVRSTIKLFCTVHSLSSGDVDKSQQHWILLLKKIWERCESNSGWLGGKRECYLCAMPPPTQIYKSLLDRLQPVVIWSLGDDQSINFRTSPTFNYFVNPKNSVKLNFGEKSLPSISNRCWLFWPFMSSFRMMVSWQNNDQFKVGGF